MKIPILASIWDGFCKFIAIPASLTKLVARRRWQLPSHAAHSHLPPPPIIDYPEVISMVAQLADISVTILSLTALAAAGWWFFGKLLCPTPLGVEVVIHGQGEGANLEQSLRCLIWLRSMGLLSCPVTLLDEGLNPQGRDIAQRLCNRWPEVVLRTVSITS